MSTYDAPNQQVVREDGSGPGETEVSVSEPESTEPDLDLMTKAALLEYAEEVGVEADDSMTKAEIREAIEER